MQERSHGFTWHKYLSDVLVMPIYQYNYFSDTNFKEENEAVIETDELEEAQVEGLGNYRSYIYVEITNSFRDKKYTVYAHCHGFNFFLNSELQTYQCKYLQQ